MRVWFGYHFSSLNSTLIIDRVDIGPYGKYVRFQEFWRLSKLIRPFFYRIQVYKNI